MALVAVLIVLFLLLIGLTMFTLSILEPVGAPSAEELPEGIEWVRSIYGWGPADNEQLHRPGDTAVGPDGTIWVTDKDNARVLAFRPDGTYRTLISTGEASQEPGHLYSPQGIEVDSDGNVYVCDYGNEKVLVFDSSGTFVREWAIPLPLDVAVRDGRIAVTSVYGVALFDMDGSLIINWGTRGSGDDQFDIPRGVAIAADGTIFVSDTHNRRVKAYEQDGTLLWIYGGRPGESEAEIEGDVPFDLPGGMTLDGKGRIVLTDSFGFNITVLDPANEGELVGKYGGFGQTEGLFMYPTSLSYDPARDWFVVADTTNDRLQIVQLPDTNDSAILPALRRATVGPVWVCAVPLVLLIAAIFVLVGTRRRERATRSTM